MSIKACVLSIHRLFFLSHSDLRSCHVFTYPPTRVPPISNSIFICEPPRADILHSAPAAVLCAPSRCAKMESGDGEAALRAPLERMPSSTESDSAFSTATEAESEMTDRDYEEGQSITPRQTYFLSYATDCLSAYESIKKRSLSGVRALDDVSNAAGAVARVVVGRESLARDGF